MKDKLWTPSFVAVCVGSFLLFFAFYMLLPILPMYLSGTFGADKSTIGLVLASYNIMALLFRPFAGFMVDKFARKPLLLLCYLLFISHFCGYIFAGTIVLFTILRASHGLAFGMITVSNSTMAIDLSPSSRRGEAIGYFGVSSNIAMALGPTFSLYMLDLWANYDYIFAAAFVSGIIGFVAVTMIQAPERIHFPQSKISLDRFLLLKGIPGAIALILMTFSYGVLMTYVAPYGKEEVGIQSSGAVGQFFAFLAVGLIASRLWVGKLINKGYITSTIIYGAILLAIGFLGLTFIKIPFFYFVSGLMLGLSYGIVCPAFQAMFINLAEHNQRGTANATYYTSWDIGLGFGVIFGGIIAEHSNYTASFFYGIVFLILGLIFFAAYPVRYFNRNKLR